MRKIFYFLTLVLAIPFVTSCEYLEDPIPQDLPIVAKKTIQTTDGDPVPSVVRYTYDISQLLRADYEGGNVHVCIYQGDLLVRINILNSDNVLRSIQHYNYDDSLRLTSALLVSPGPNQGLLTTYLYNPDNSITATTYSGTANQQDELVGTATLYIGTNGEIVTEVKTTSDGTFTTTYTYDDKNNPFINVLGFNRLLIPERRYNLVSSQTINEFSEVISQQNFTITYNEEFFPIVSVRSTTGEPSTTTEFFYE